MIVSAASGDEVRLEYALQFPDGHREGLHVHADGSPVVPGWAADYGVELVCSEVRRSPWVVVPR